MNALALGMIGAIVLFFLASRLRSSRGTSRSTANWFGLRPALSPSTFLVQGRVWLTPNHSIHMVEISGRALVIGCHANGMILLRESSSEKASE